MADSRSEAGVIGQYAQSAATPHKVCENSMGSMQAIGGAIQLVEYPHHSSDLELDGLADVATVAASELWSKTPTLFADGSAVRLCLDGDDRRKLAVMPLRLSEQWKSVRAMAQGGLTGTPADLVPILRFDYSHTGGATATLINALRDTRFSQSSEMSAKVEHGGNTFGRKTNAAVDKSDQIPDEFPMTFRPFLAGGCDFTVTVQIGVDIDPHRGTVTLKPLGGEIDLAEAAAVRLVKEKATEHLAAASAEGVLVIGGSPAQ